MIFGFRRRFEHLSVGVWTFVDSASSADTSDCSAWSAPETCGCLAYVFSCAVGISDASALSQSTFNGGSWDVVLLMSQRWHWYVLVPTRISYERGPVSRSSRLEAVGTHCNEYSALAVDVSVHCSNTPALSWQLTVHDYHSQQNDVAVAEEQPWEAASCVCDP